MLPRLEDIVRMRRILGLTQTQLAKLAGISQSLVAKIESGKIDPSYSKAKILFETLDRLQMKGTKKASEIMVTDIVGVIGDDTVDKAVNLMNEYAISQMPVFEGEKVIGSVTDRILVKLVSEGQPLEGLLKEEVRKVMNDPFPTVAEDTPLELLSSILNFYPAVLVTRKDRVIGIVTRSDLLKP